MNYEERLRKNLLDSEQKHAYLMDDDSEHKKVKGTKKCVIKRALMVKNDKDCLFNNKIISKLQKKI